MSLIQNPILRGFNADPSIIRVEDTYYIANSTFEWFPGVRLHESKDLEHWNLLPSPLCPSSSWKSDASNPMPFSLTGWLQGPRIFFAVVR